MLAAKPSVLTEARFALKKVEDDLAQDVWVDDYEEERYNVRKPIFESTGKEHTFTEDERKRMNRYESLDYWDEHSLVYKEYIRNRKKRWARWLVFLAIGVGVGIWEVLFGQTLDLISEVKINAFEAAVKSATPTNSTKGLTRSGAPYSAAFAGLGTLMAWTIILSFASTFSCTRFPAAAGSGVPDVISYLNGVLLPQIFNIRVLLYKSISCLFGICCGLPMGAEGPTIHIGALIGAGLPQGGSKTLRIPGLASKAYSDPENMRDFVSAGAAAGVAAAFSSPIGGLMFVMEEMASFFPVKLAWMVFMTCLATILVLQLANSYIHGWTPRDREGIPTGAFLDSSIAMFNTDQLFQQIELNLYAFIPAVAIGLGAGFIAIVFTIGNIKVLKLRGKYISIATIRKCAEPISFAIFYVLVCFFLPLAFECQDLPPPPEGEEDWLEKLDLKLIRSVCKDPDTQFHPLGSLLIPTSYNALRLLLSRHTATMFPWHALLIFQFVYTTGAMVTCGMFISSGIIIPALTIGAIWGRLIGVAFDQSWADPGLCALMGSVAFFAGQSRLTFSLIVIMMELTGDLGHLPTLMVCVFLAKSIADKFCHSMYHQIIEFKCVPFLDLTSNIHKLDTYPVKTIMSIEPKTVRTSESVKEIVRLLMETNHNCFPVVSIVDNATFRGTILKKQLSALLWWTHWQEQRKFIPEVHSNNPCNTDSGGKEARHVDYETLQRVKRYMHWEHLPSVPPELNPELLRCVIDLNPYVDSAALCTREVCSLSRAYSLFRHMSLRHLPVVDQNNRIIGMLTRKDFIMDRVKEKIEALNKSLAGGEDDDDDESDHLTT